MTANNTKRLPSYIGGIFAIIAGFFFITMPEISSGVIGILFGVVLFVAGLSEVIGYIISIKQFREENYGKAAGAEIVLVYSIILMALGLFFIIRHEIVLQLLTTIVGIFFLIDGVVKLRQEIFLFTKKDIYSWFLLIMAIALIAAGIILLTNALYGTRNIIVFSGCAFIISGLETCFFDAAKRKDNKTKTRKD
jgi:uncharacterized membrane protein HdeD (DUF308 family)